MEKKKKLVVGLGELLWDMFFDENGIFIEKKPGGAPVNPIYHVAQLGGEGYAISAVGNDELGIELLGELKKKSISSDYIRTVDYPTGTVLVEMKEKSHTFTIVEGVAWDHIPMAQASVDLVKRADAVFFGTLALRAPESNQAIHTLLSAVPSEALRFFDINIRQHFYSKGLIDRLLRQANVFKINDEELKMLGELFGFTGSDSEVCRRFMDTYHLRYVILTAGAVCSTIYSPDEISSIWTPKVEVEDTVGAGDAFSGAFVYSILTGKSLREAHQRAVDIAAFVCSKRGAWPEYPIDL